MDKLLAGQGSDRGDAGGQRALVFAECLLSAWRWNILEWLAEDAVGGESPLYLDSDGDSGQPRGHRALAVEGFHQEGEGGLCVREGFIIQGFPQGQLSRVLVQAEILPGLLRADPIIQISAQVHVLGLQGTQGHQTKPIPTECPSGV